MHPELLLDHPGDHGRGPDSGVQTIGHRTAVQNVPQRLPFRALQLRWSSGALSFQQTFDPMHLIACQPLGNLGAWGLQNRRQLPAAAPLRIQHYCLQTLGHTIRSVPFRLLAQANQPLISARVQTNHSRQHGTPLTESMPSFSCYVPLIMRRCISERILPTVLGLPTAQTSPRASPQVDEFGDALAVEALQGICQNAPFPSRWNFALDQATALQWRRGRDEQQDQVHQPSFLRLSYRPVLHRSYLSLLRQTAVTC